MTLTNVRKATNLRNGRSEVWEADEGPFHFERLETTGTPWVVTLQGTEGWEAPFPSLSKARKGAARVFGFSLALSIIRAAGLERPHATGKVHVA